MERKQMLALFVGSLVPWTMGNGLIPLLPVYVTSLGASSSLAGLYLAAGYLALAAGALSAGWVSGRLHRRKLPLILIGVVGVPVVFLMGQVTTVLGLAVLTALWWFTGGLGLALVSILAGLSAREDERGRVFGLLALTSGLGALIGSLGIGYLVERWGYSTMFSALAVFAIILPLMATLLTEKQVEGEVHDRLAQGEPRSARSTEATGVRLGQSFRLLFAAGVLSSVSGFLIIMVRSLQMRDLGFGAIEINSTAAVGGFVAIPVPLLMGWLSDRRERKPFLYLGYLAMLTGLAVLVVSTSLWQFWVVLALQGAAVAINNAIGNALVTDLVPPEKLSRGLALFSATIWLGGILGFAGTGLFLQSLGVVTTLLIGMGLVLAAAALIIPMRARARGAVSVAPVGR